ncbi:hypothetical protein KR084_000906 [Drosophila pseudotakahashii]|nr:hypothetical protein KR084_000906 [Drosophila pseudotakahashii]
MGKHRSPAQDAIFLRFIRDNIDIAKGFTRGDRVLVTTAWEDLASELNAHGPPCKTADGWRRVWKDWKQSIKKKIATNKKETRATGGGHFQQEALTATGPGQSPSQLLFERTQLPGTAEPWPAGTRAGLMILGCAPQSDETPL